MHLQVMGGTQEEGNWLIPLLVITVVARAHDVFSIVGFTKKQATMKL